MTRRWLDARRGRDFLFGPRDPEGAQATLAVVAGREQNGVVVVTRKPLGGRRVQRRMRSPSASRDLGLRLIGVRSLSLAALTASAMLWSDVVRHGRGFCPIDAACSKARESALGSIAGVPTSFLGLVAFATLFAITFLPARRLREIVRPTAMFAGACGIVFLVYQAFVVGRFCPFCVVADSAGVFAGVIALSWPSSAKPVEPPRLGATAHAAWALAAVLAIGAPLTWPREQAPAWIPVPVLEDTVAGLPPLREADEFGPGVIETGVVSDVAPSSPIPTAPHETVSPALGSVPVVVPPEPPPPPTPVVEPRGVPPEAPPPPAPLPVNDDAPIPPAPPPPPAPVEPPTVVASAETEPVVAPDPPPAPAPVESVKAPESSEPPPVIASKPAEPAAAPAAKPAATPRAPSAPEVTVVEYVNAFCPHCRATHTQLDEALRAATARVKRYRVYVWSSKDIPFWAQACACAATWGKENELFNEIMRLDRDDPRAIARAASRIGLDVDALWASVQRGDARARLEGEWRRVTASQIRQMPTLDIGSRRLEGEQSVTEIAAAIIAAAAESRSAALPTAPSGHAEGILAPR